MEEILNLVGKEKTACYFVSPHIDDAVLSAGNLMLELSKVTKVTVVNVFTNADKGNSLSARVTLNRVGLKDSKKYVRIRKNEEKAVAKVMNIKIVDLNYVDALWRKRIKISPLRRLLSLLIPELALTYPTYKFHIQKGKISKQEKYLIKTISKRLNFIEPEAFIFAPLSTGDHVDHLIVHEAVKNLKNVIYWSDFPYNLGTMDKRTGYKKVAYKTAKNAKETLIREYKSQVNLLFPNGIIPKKSEIFFSKI